MALESEKGTDPKTSLPTSMLPSCRFISISEYLKIWPILGDIADSRSGAQNVPEKHGNSKTPGNMSEGLKTQSESPLHWPKMGQFEHQIE